MAQTEAKRKEEQKVSGELWRVYSVPSTTKAESVAKLNRYIEMHARGKERLAAMD